MVKAINAADFVQQPYIGSPDKTRNKPIDPELERILTQVAQETGVTFVVESGGQDEKGTKNARRTGSTRHDDGRAGDVKAKGPDGKFIDFSTPAGKQQWSNIVTRARSLGATGIGAGPSYMGTQTVHIGFGSPAAWSSVKSGQPVEGWLRTAYDAGAKMPPGSIPEVASYVDVPRTKPVQLMTATNIDQSTRDTLAAAGFRPGNNADAAIRAFQTMHGLKVDGIIGDKTRAVLQSVTTAPAASAPSPVPSRGVVVTPGRTTTAPQIDPRLNGRGMPPPVGSSFRGGWGSNGFNLPGMNRVDPLSAAPPGSATGGDWDMLNPNSPAYIRATTPSGTLPLTANLNAFTQPTAVASLVDVPKRTRKTVTKPVVTPTQKKGYNGKTTLTSNDLAGVHGGSDSIFGENAVLPPSMNNERWITGY